MPKESKVKSKNARRRPWREAVYDAMYKAALDEARRQSPFDQPPFMYRWEHVKAVVKNAIKLAALTGADADVVEAAAWLHDIAKDSGEDHPRQGAKMARQLLVKTDFPEAKIAAVAQAIEEHKGLWLEAPLSTLEAQVLWEADKLTKIGLLAAVHWLAASIVAGKDNDTEGIIRDHQAAEWRARTVASMQTPAARQAAAQRFDAYNWLWQELESEWFGADLSVVSAESTPSSLAAVSDGVA